MRTEVVTGVSVATTVAEAEEARSLRRDATAMVERMAVRERAAGVEHPVAAAVAQAVRVSQLAGPEDFADRLGVVRSQWAAAESGTVAFSDLPPELDRVLAPLALDLLSLADLEACWVGSGVHSG